MERYIRKTGTVERFVNRTVGKLSNHLDVLAERNFKQADSTGFRRYGLQEKTELRILFFLERVSNELSDRAWKRNEEKFSVKV